MSKKYYRDRPTHKFNWELIISLMMILGTTLGTTIPLYMQCNSQISAIREEMKDFHGRLCAIEERYRK